MNVCKDYVHHPHLLQQEAAQSSSGEQASTLIVEDGKAFLRACLLLQGPTLALF